MADNLHVDVYIALFRRKQTYIFTYIVTLVNTQVFGTIKQRD